MPIRFLNPAKRLAPGWYSKAEFWKTLRRAAVSAGRKSLVAALTLFYCLQDKDTPKWAKDVIIGALGYLILPTDLIPDAIPAIGFTDDWGAILTALSTVTAYIKEEHKIKAEEQIQRLLGSNHSGPPQEIFE